MATYRLHPSSLDPPPPSADEDAADILPWVLVELQAYVAKRDNATTASTKTGDGKQIQVTLCPRHPPQVSYLCVHSDAEISMEPHIIAMEDDLVLLRVTLGSPRDIFKPESSGYYVYQADDGFGRPSLEQLPQPPSSGSRRFSAAGIGIMRDHPDGRGGIFLRPHRPGHNIPKGYTVVGLHQDLGDPEDQFVLSVYRSMWGGDWKTYNVSLNQQQQEYYQKNQCHGDSFYHKNCKVIAIGGDSATMAFVDLWRGILFCDVSRVEDAGAAGQVDVIPMLRYVPLPDSIQKRLPKGDARLYHDIALVEGGVLKYVELWLKWKASVVIRGAHFPDGWVAATFSMPIGGALDDNSWHQECKIESKDVDDRDNLYLKLLPKAPSDDGVCVPPFKRLDVCQPVLSLQSDAEIVYFTTKVNRMDEDAWVVSVDLREKTLRGVASFAAARTLGINFAYTHSRVSKHLKKFTPGMPVVGNLKRKHSTDDEDGHMMLD